VSTINDGLVALHVVMNLWLVQFPVVRNMQQRFGVGFAQQGGGGGDAFDFVQVTMPR